MFELSKKWAPILLSQPETGMGFQIISVYLRDGRRIDNVGIVGGTVAGVNGKDEIPFAEEDIVDIKVMNAPQRH
ncbi:MAG: hypothetical protein WBR15_05480 [Gammaproteobacteria bacterium]